MSIPETSDDPTYASFWRRMAGLLYDLMIVLAIVMVVGLVAQIATHGKLITDAGGITIPDWYRPLQYVVVLSYFIISWLRGGQTIGMRPWRMRLRMIDGRPVSFIVALFRALAASIPLLLLVTGDFYAAGDVAMATLAAWVVWFGIALIDRRHRALHDIIAGTCILHDTRPRPARRKHK